MLLDHEPEPYGRAAARWTARYCLEVREVGLEEALGVLSAVQLMAAADRALGQRQLLELCRARSLGEVCGVLERASVR